MARAMSLGGGAPRAGSEAVPSGRASGATLPSEVPRIDGWKLRVAFAGIIVVFVGINAVLFHQAHLQQRQTRLIVTNMLASVQLVSGMADDLDEERILVDALTHETPPSGRSRIEARLAQVRQDIAASVRRYGPIATEPGEPQAWERAQSEIAGVERVIDRALALSRADRNEQAQALMTANLERFSALDGTIDELIRINRDAADRAGAEAHAIALANRRYVLLLTLAGVILASVAAWGFTRGAHRNEELLRQLSSNLEERNRELDAFAGRVAHDLRGPLTTVSLAGGQLARGAPDARASERFERGVARMNALIDDLLALARIDVEARGAECDAAAIADSVRQELEPRIQGEGGRLRVEVEDARVRCTEGLLVEALANLGDNAIKYRRPDVPLEVQLRGRSEDGAYVYSLTDNGVGMTRQDAEHVFEPFYRAERTRAVSGTGLGLAIVRRIVEAHGGSVLVDSEPGVGTTFTLRLPRAAASKR